MSELRAFVKRCIAMFRKGDRDALFDEELQTHFEMLVEENIECGLSPEEARRCTRLVMGTPDQIKEAVRDQRGLPFVESLVADLRFAFRMLRKAPGFSAVALVTLALGIGASTVVFSVIYDGLLNPFPYRDAGGISIFQIHNADQRGNGGRGAFTFNEFLDYREQNHVFSDMAGTSTLNVLYESAGGAQELGGGFVTTNTFPFLGVKPLLGRWLTDDDGKPGAPPVFVLSYRCWVEQFGSDPKILGAAFTLNGVSRTLVGIMPPRFRYFGSSVYFPVGLYRGAADSVNEYGRPRYFLAEERRKPGVTLQAIAADIDVIARRLAAVYPKDYPKRFTIWTDSLASDVVGDSKQILYVLLAAVGALLLIACSNVANLLLSRATAREKEIALRASLGASQCRLLRQLLVESLVLAAAGGAMGCLIAYGGIQLVAATIPPILPGEAALELNRPVLLFAFGIALLTVLACGLAPAAHALRGSLSLRLSGSGKGSSGSFRHGKLRGALVVVEVALSIVLLAGAGLMMRTLYALTHVSLGFDSSDVLAADVTVPSANYTTVAEKKAFFQQALARIAALPGVISAAETISLPPYNAGRSEVTVPGAAHSEAWDTLFDVCSEEYFKTLSIPLLHGRLLSQDDVDSGRFVAVVNQTFARNYLGDDPIGRKFKFNVFDTIAQTPHDAYFEVVGIVSDVKNQGLQDAPLPQAYIPYTITAYANRAILVKTAVPPLSLVKDVRSAIWAVDRNVAIGSASTLDAYLDEFSYAQPKFGLLSIGAFAAIGLVLAAIGVFSVMAYAVSLQTHDIGVRMALGAQPADILRMVLSKGMALVAAGCGAGLAIGLVVTRLLSSQLWGVSASDPLTFSIVVLVVIAVGAAASFIPARRATRVAPLIALREE